MWTAEQAGDLGLGLTIVAMILLLLSRLLSTDTGPRVLGADALALLAVLIIIASVVSLFWLEICEVRNLN